MDVAMPPTAGVIGLSSRVTEERDMRRRTTRDDSTEYDQTSGDVAPGEDLNAPGEEQLNHGADDALCMV